MKGHVIYLGMRKRVVMLESGALLDPPYAEIGRVNGKPVFRFPEGVPATQVIEDVSADGESIGVVCLDDSTRLVLGGSRNQNGRSVSPLGREMLSRDREGLNFAGRLADMLRYDRND